MLTENLKLLSVINLVTALTLLTCGRSVLLLTKVAAVNLDNNGV